MIIKNPDAKFEKTAALYQAIGEIDDSTLAGALKYKKKSTSKVLRPFILIAACLSLVFVLIIGSLAFGIAAIISKLPSILPPSGSDINDSAPSDAPNKVYDSLSSILINASDEMYASNASEIDLFSDQAYIIWKTDESDTVYRKELSKNRLQNLRSPISSTTSKNNNDTSEISVWIAYGNGTVVSPYLTESYGNIGYGQLFDYSEEVEPSKELVELIKNSLS